MKIQHKVDKICDMISHRGPVEQLWTAQIGMVISEVRENKPNYFTLSSNKASQITFSNNTVPVSIMVLHVTNTAMKINQLSNCKINGEHI